MNVANWNAFDWVLVAIVVLSMVRAFITGLVRAIAGLAGIITGYVVASWAYVDLAEQFRERGWIVSQYMARGVAFLAIVLAVVMVFELLGRAARKSLRTIGLGTFDRIFGSGVWLRPRMPDRDFTADRYIVLRTAVCRLSFNLL